MTKEIKENILLEFFCISCGIVIVLLNIVIIDEQNFSFDEMLPTIVLEEIIDDYILYSIIYNIMITQTEIFKYGFYIESIILDYLQDVKQ